MRKLIGPHVAGLWANKLDILRQWQPPFVVVLSPDVDKVQQLREACPNTVIVGRFYHDDSYYAENIRTRPDDFAHDMHSEIIRNPVTPLLDYVQTNNEVCQDWEGIQQLNKFALRSMALADESQAYKCAILAFSVGNPDLPYKPGDPAGFDGRMLYWQQVLPSLNYAQRNDHLLLLHAYGYPDMFHPDADWYIYRYERQVQANLKTLGITSLKYAYGEIGIDKLIVNEVGGYKGITTDQDYVNQLLQWERDQQSQNLLLGGAIFTFGDSGGWGSYDIADTNVAPMIAAHYTDNAGDYAADVASEKETTFLPSVGTGEPTATAPDLPPREWDERLTQRGVKVVTPDVAPGQEFWRVTKARWYDEQESQGRHHIYVDVQYGTPFVVAWPTGAYDDGVGNGKTGFDAANYPMSASLNEFSVAVDYVYPSETIIGIGMGANGNPNAHTSTGVTFQLVTMPQAAQPESPTEQPPVPSPPDDRWQRSREFVRIWEGGYQNVPNDSGNWTGGKVGVGENKGTKFGISAASYPDLDIKNLTMEQADAIYFRDYWQASGADKLPWPACLLVFDTAVLHGVGTARNWLLDVGPNAFAFASKRLHVYTRMTNWDTWGKGWVNRTADLLERAGQA